MLEGLVGKEVADVKSVRTGTWVRLLWALLRNGNLEGTVAEAPANRGKVGKVASSFPSQKVPSPFFFGWMWCAAACWRREVVAYRSSVSHPV